MKTLSIDDGLDKDGDHVVDTSELADALQDDSVTADAAENLAKAIDEDEKLSTPDDAVAGADDIVDVVDADEVKRLEKELGVVKDGDGVSEVEKDGDGAVQVEEKKDDEAVEVEEKKDDEAVEVEEKKDEVENDAKVENNAEVENDTVKKLDDDDAATDNTKQVEKSDTKKEEEVSNTLISESNNVADTKTKEEDEDEKPSEFILVESKDEKSKDENVNTFRYIANDAPFERAYYVDRNGKQAGPCSPTAFVRRATNTLYFWFEGRESWSKLQDAPKIFAWVRSHQWFVVNRNGEKEGPYTMDELSTMPGVCAKTFCWRFGMSDWTRKGDLVLVE